MSHKRRTPCCAIEAHRFLDNIEGDHDTLAADLALAAAVREGELANAIEKILPDDFYIDEPSTPYTPAEQWFDSDGFADAILAAIEEATR